MKSKLILMALILTFVSFFTLFSCAEKSKPTESAAKSEIVVGLLDDLSGPFAGSASVLVEGEKDGIRYINEIQGGVLGHPLRATVIDFKLDGTLALTGWERLKGEGVPVVYGYSLGLVPVIGNAANEDRIPILTSGGNVNQLFPTEESYFFALMPWAYGQYDHTLTLMEQDWKKKGKSGTPKIGFDLPSFGNYGKIYGKCAKLASEKRGWKYIITTSSIAPTDLTTQVLQMKEFQCDYIYMSGTDAGAIAWIKELARKPDFKPQLVTGSSPFGSPEVWNACGKSAAGIIFWQLSPSWDDTDLPYIKKLHELNAKWHPEKSNQPIYYGRGFAYSLTVAEALKRAIGKVGIENLNGTAVMNALDTFQNFDPYGMGANFSWTPTDRQGLHGSVWYQWTEDGKYKRVTDWIEFAPLPMEQRNQDFWLSN